MDQLENLVEATIISGGIAAGSTTLYLETGHGSRVPDPSNGEYNLFIYNSTDYTSPLQQHVAYLDGIETEDVECVRVISKSTDTLTIERAQENTSDVNHNKSGKTYKVILTVSKKIFEDIENTFIRKPELYQRSANFSTYETTFIDVPDMSVNLEANKRYIIKGVIYSSTTSPEVQYVKFAPINASFSGYLRYGVPNGVMLDVPLLNHNISIFGLFLINTIANAAMAYFDFIIKTSASGTLKIQIKRDDNGGGNNVTFSRGSYFLIEEI